MFPLPDSEPEPIWESKEEQETKVVYPFYQYGAYTRYDPEHAEYYLPGTLSKEF